MTTKRLREAREDFLGSCSSKQHIAIADKRWIHCWRRDEVCHILSTGECPRPSAPDNIIKEVKDDPD